MNAGAPAVRINTSPAGLVLVLLVLVVAGVATWLLMSAWQERTLDHAMASPTVEQKPVERGASGLPDQTFQTALLPPVYPNMITRPLFANTRRPPEEAPAPKEPEVEEKPVPEPDPVEASLRSVIITPSERFAWLQPQGEDRQIRLVPGDELDGWTLDVVERTYVEFRADDASMRVELRPLRSVGDASNPERPRPRARNSRR